MQPYLVFQLKVQSIYSKNDYEIMINLFKIIINIFELYYPNEKLIELLFKSINNKILKWVKFFKKNQFK